MHCSRPANDLQQNCMNPSVKCNLKNLVVLIDTKLPEKSRYYLYKPFMNIIGSQERQNFESMHELFVICTCVTTLQSCYTGMPSFSASQKRVITNNVIKY